MQFTKHFGF